VREARVYSELVSHRATVEEIRQRNPVALILSGGPASVYADGAPKMDAAIFELGIPTLGICYGAQLLALELGGRVDKTGAGEYGKVGMQTGEGSLFATLPGEQTAWMSHRDTVVEPPAGARIVATSEHTPVAAFEDDERKLYGVQFHPEVVHTPHGQSLLENFLYGLAGAAPAWTPAAVIEEQVARIVATSEHTPVAAFEDDERKLYGVQFHPEVVHTPHGQSLLENFLYELAGAAPAWTPAAVIEEQVARIRAEVGDERVLCALSGGVDSAVAALLVHKAIGEQLTCVFVDHGLLRKGEAEQVVATFDGLYHVPLVHVQAQERFVSKLGGVTDPEQKRKIIGEEFIRVFEDEARALGDVKWLVQGTLYSDVIESGGTDGVAETIKSHHNVGGLPADMEMKLVEPLRLLFKDEVRRVGEELGMPERMVWRQPFPGPGLAIRIIGDVTEERLETLREADAILQDEVRRAGLYRELWQSFCVLPAIRSVGVQGDSRTYGYPIAIRAVTSEDAMTADWARLPYDLIELVSSRIINEIPAVNRVVLDVTSKPPATIEWE
jgi:GMP synthase (glutamine-hydrolysing)